MSVVESTAAAKRGDLILVEQKRCDYVVGEGSSERIDYTFGIVASATRDGKVKTWRAVGWGDELVSAGAQPIRYDRCMVASKRTVDVNGTLAAAKAHHWPGHPGQPKSFDSIESAKAVVVKS